MAEVKIRKHIAAPPEKVFSVAIDVPSWADNIRGIEKIEMLTDGPVGVGTRFRETRMFMKQEATEEMEITALDPPRGYSVGAENHGCRFHTEVTFTPVGSGTDIEMRFEAEPLTPLAKIMSAMMKPMIAAATQCLEEDLDDLKAHIEP